LAETATNCLYYSHNRILSAFFAKEDKSSPAFPELSANYFQVNGVFPDKGRALKPFAS